MGALRMLTAAFLLALMALPIGLLGLPVAPIAQAQEVGPAADRIVWVQFTLEEIAQAFREGKVDVYLFGLDPDVATVLAQDPNIKLYTAPAGLVDFGLNPAPVQIVEVDQIFATKEEAAEFFGVDPVVIRAVEPNEEEGITTVEFCALQTNLPGGVTEVFRSDVINFNPFCFRDIRFALNYVVDRERMVNEVYQGFAIPKYTFYGPDDPVYTELIDVVAQFRFTYQPALAQSIIDDIMTRAGAEKREGRWFYLGEPVRIIGIIRVEDQRFQLGQIFARELRNLGFTVQVQELTFFEAILKVYFTNPIDFEWMFYTEGWGKGAIDKWDAGNLAQFGATWLGWAPGWGEADYWNYKPEVVDEAGNNVDFYSEATFTMEGITSKEQWIEYLRKGTVLGTMEAHRIWIAATLDAFPARAEVVGLTLDMGAGLRGLFNCRGWTIRGAESPVTITVGHLWAWTTRSVWNVIGGFLDVYSVDPARCTFDPFTWFHPFNGRPIPFRVDFEVTTAGPEGSIEVPEDAIYWDAENDRWAFVTELGIERTATSKVVLDLSKFIGTRWHHGQEITWADLLAYWAELFDIAYDPEKSQIESSIAGPLKTALDIYVGFRPLLDENKIEVYFNFWHFDEAYIGSTAVVATVELPLELLLFHDYIGFVTKEMALSDTRSRSEGLPQLSLILPEHVAVLKEYFEGEFSEAYDMYKGYFTLPDGTVLLSEEEWMERIQAVLDWVNEYNLAWISQGPWKLVFFDKDAQRLEFEAFRDPTYPFGPRDWVFGEPQPTVITDVLTSLVAPGEPAQVIVRAAGVPPVFVKYLLRDPITGELLASGDAIQTPTGFIIDFDPEFTSTLSEFSVYELIVIAFSSEIALPDEEVVALQTVQSIRRAVAEIEERITDVQEQFQEQLQGVQDQIESLQEVLGGQLAEAVGGLSQAIEGLSEAVGGSIQNLGDTLGDTLSGLQSNVDELGTQIQTLNTQIQELNEAIGDVGEAAQSAQSTARTAMIIGIINLLVLLGIAGLLFLRRS